MVQKKNSFAENNNDSTEVLSPSDLMDLAETVPEGSFEIGSVLDGYEIERILGEGGGGIVYGARHRENGQEVAIKVLRPEMLMFPTMIKRFVREADAVNKIQHPNIVQLFAFGETSNGLPYYVMELLNGIDLRKLLKAHGRFSPGEALSLFEPICNAVQAAHDAGFIHRDIKANNVAVVEENGTRTIKLLDFGIAKLLHGEPNGQGLTEPGSMLGSPHSMAPEQIRGERLDQRVDVYALGVLLFQVLTGHYPFYAADPRETALLHLQAPAPRPSSFAPVSPALDAVVLRCLEKSRERRYANVSELMSALRAAVGTDLEAEGPDAAPAVGLYFQLSTDNDDDMDDEMIEDISNVLDTLEHNLTSQGYQLPLRTSNALLGVRVLDNDQNRSRDRADAEAIVLQLRQLLDEREGRHPRVKVVASMTVGEALCRGEGPQVEIIGGPLLEIETWTNTGRRAAS